MRSILTIDRAGRLVIPKAVRDQHGLGPGSEIELTDHGSEIRLRPVAEAARCARSTDFSSTRAASTTRRRIRCSGTGRHASGAWPAADPGVAGGRLYDALILACAIKSAARVIYTLNERDFQALAPQDVRPRIRRP